MTDRTHTEIVKEINETDWTFTHVPQALKAVLKWGRCCLGAPSNFIDHLRAELNKKVKELKGEIKEAQEGIEEINGFLQQFV